MIELSGEPITLSQRRYIYVLIRYVADWAGEGLEETKVGLKEKFLQFAPDFDWFSLSDCPLELASEFIEWILYYCKDNDIYIDPYDKHPLRAA